MIFNSKQLEELENIHDSTGAFEEEGDDESGFDEVGEAAMDWRRGFIEEAAENIKRAKTRPVEQHLTYPIGSMLFERDARRFARVQRSVPGYLKIVYLSGGDREFGTLDVTGYLRDYGAEKRLSELAEQLGMNDGDVATELERLGITPLEEPEVDEAAVAAEAEAAAATPVPPPVPRGKKAAPVEANDEDDDEVPAAADSDDNLPVADDELSPAGRTSGAKAGAKAAPAAARGNVPVGKAAVVVDKAPATKAAPAPAARGLPANAKSALTTAKAVPAKPVQGKAAPVAPPAARTPAPVAAKAGGSGGASKAAAVSPAKPMPGKAAASAKAAAPAKASAPGAKSSKEQARAAKASAAPPGAIRPADAKGINPIDDPNGYIKAHFQELSNRELARLTGLSEHTIRRKLGEWGMKRKH